MADQDTAPVGARSGLDILSESEKLRLDLLGKIGAARDSVVIAYFTSIRPGLGERIRDEDVRVLERHLGQARKEGARNIDLFLCTHGGDSIMPWNFHAMFRDYFPRARFGVFVPFEAFSAGTGIALGADELILGRTSVLGPTDTQMNGVSVNTFSAFLDLLAEFDKSGRVGDRHKLEWLTRQTDPFVLGRLYRVWKENRRKILNILASRRRPLSARENEKIADYFLYQVGLHAQGIRRREAKDAGVSYVVDLEETGVEAATESLFAAYADAMKLFAPFMRGGFVDKADADLNTPLVVIESVYETNPAFFGFGHPRNWDPPATLLHQAGADGERPPATISWRSQPHGDAPAARAPKPR